MLILVYLSNASSGSTPKSRILEVHSFFFCRSNDLLRRYFSTLFSCRLRVRLISLCWFRSSSKSVVCCWLWFWKCSSSLSISGARNILERLINQHSRQDAALPDNRSVAFAIFFSARFNFFWTFANCFPSALLRIRVCFMDKSSRRRLRLTSNSSSSVRFRASIY
jgi:hypothetical protein